MSKICRFIDTKNADRNKLIFLLVEKIYKSGEKAVIFTNNDDRANDLDRFLWIHKQEAFIPHKIFKYEEEDAPEKIAIVIKEINPIRAAKIILDYPCSLEFASTFDEIIDFADHTSEKSLQESRKRFKKFKESGFIMDYKKDFKEDENE